jgi:hypothetical protein
LPITIKSISQFETYKLVSPKYIKGINEKEQDLIILLLGVDD